MSAIINENQSFQDTGGHPLVGGFIYIGLQNLDPVLNPKPIFSDRALTVALANPQTLDSLGKSTNKIWTDGAYSMKIEDVNNVQIYEELDNGETAGIGVIALTNVIGINTLTANASPTITRLRDDFIYELEIVSANTSDAVTLNIDGLGAKTIQRNLTLDVGIGRFKVGQKVLAIYNEGNDNFELVNDNQSVILGNNGAGIAAAATVDLTAATGNNIDVSGDTTITSFGTVIAGAIFNLTFTGSPIIAFNATSMILMGLANLQAKPGSTLSMKSLGSGNWEAINFQFGAGVSLYPPGHINGLRMANNSGDATNDIDIAVGSCRAENIADNIDLATLITKQINAPWAVGSAAGGFPSGLTLTNSTWYHVFLIKRSDTGVVDAGFDTSTTAANLLADATGYDAYYAVGSVFRGVALNTLFEQSGNRIIWDASVEELTGNGTIAGASLTVQSPVDVECVALMTMGGFSTAAAGPYWGLLTPLSITNNAPTSAAFNANGGGTGVTDGAAANVEVTTDTFSAIRERVSSNTSFTWEIHIHGYIDPRAAIK